MVRKEADDVSVGLEDSDPHVAADLCYRFRELYTEVRAPEFRVAALDLAPALSQRLVEFASGDDVNLGLGRLLI
jgi:hypothetical protein